MHLFGTSNFIGLGYHAVLMFSRLGSIVLLFPRQLSSALVNSRQPSSTLVNPRHSSSTLVNPRQLSSTLINILQPLVNPRQLCSSTFVNPRQRSSTLVNPYQLSSSLVKPRQFSFIFITSLQVLSLLSLVNYHQHLLFPLNSNFFLNNLNWVPFHFQSGSLFYPTADILSVQVPQVLYCSVPLYQGRLYRALSSKSTLVYPGPGLLGDCKKQNNINELRKMLWNRWKGRLKH